MSNDDFFGSTLLPDVMIDIETMGTRPNSPIVALGAVAFDHRACKLGAQFYRTVDLESSVALGAIIDPGTVMWWLGQSDDARNALTRNARPVNEVLLDFTLWLEDSSVPQDGRKIWAAGIDFDCVMLAEHYRRALLPVPWHFYNQRDYRTVRELFPNIEQAERKGKHNALDDAVHQAEHLFKIRRTLRSA